MLWSIEKTFSYQPIKSNLRTYDNIWKTMTGQGDDYTTSCLSDYNYVSNYYKMIAINSSKQQALNADPKAIQQINFTWNLKWAENVNDNTMFSLLK